MNDVMCEMLWIIYATEYKKTHYRLKTAFVFIRRNTFILGEMSSDRKIQKKGKTCRRITTGNRCWAEVAVLNTKYKACCYSAAFRHKLFTDETLQLNSTCAALEALPVVIDGNRTHNRNILTSDATAALFAHICF